MFKIKVLIDAHYTQLIEADMIPNVGDILCMTLTGVLTATKLNDKYYTSRHEYLVKERIIDYDTKEIILKVNQI